MGFLTDFLIPCIEQVVENTQKSMDEYKESYDEYYETASERYEDMSMEQLQREYRKLKNQSGMDSKRAARTAALGDEIRKRRGKD